MSSVTRQPRAGPNESPGDTGDGPTGDGHSGNGHSGDGPTGHGHSGNGHADVVSARMLRLATARSTGVLKVSGDCEGAIHFHQGQVVFARSERTPGPLRPADVSRRLADGPASVGRLGQLQDILMVVEPIVDAVVDLLSGGCLCRRFRSGGAPHQAPACSIAVGDLLAEVARQQRQLQRMSTAITPDTPVRRNPRLAPARVQVSGWQWGLLIRVRPGMTPRDLAHELGRTVFGTTADVYDLIVLGLLYVGGATAMELS